MSVSIVLASLCVMLMTASHAVGAGIAVPPTIELCEARQIHSGRAELFAKGKSDSQVHYHFEYAQNENGPWTATESGTANLTDINVFAVNVEIHHLTAATVYYARVFVENDTGPALKLCTFKTAAVSPPEVTHLQIRQAEAETSVGKTYADFEAEVDSNGADTTYQFEYNTTGPNGPWPEAPASGTGTSGTVTAGEDFLDAKAHITGLSAQTTYYLRVVAKSIAGEGQSSRAFTTVPESPEAFMGTFSGVGASAAHLRATIRSRSLETAWRFEYDTSLSKLEKGEGSIGPEGLITTAEATEGFSHIEAQLTGLSAATIYYVRVRATNGHEPLATSQPRNLETGGPPVVLTFAAHTYAPGSETLRVLGSVQPRGSETHFYFEYVSQEEFESSGWTTALRSPERDAGEGAYVDPQGFPVEITGNDLSGLDAGKEYRYRLVASSVQGTSTGGDQTLTVPVSAGGEVGSCSNSAMRGGISGRLPDCRAYEQVTPVEKAGSMDNWVYSGNVSTPVLVGEDGDHVMVRPQFSKWGSSADATNSSFFFSRTGTDGWLMTSATPQPEAGGNSYRPELFSPNLTQIGLNVGWSTGVDNASHDLELVAGLPGGPYTMVTSAARSNNPAWVAASRDFGKMVLSSGGNLFERASGELRQVNGSCLATMASATGGGVPGGAVSQEGSRVFFEALSGGGCVGVSHLYMRENGESTTDIGAYKFVAADADGSRLLLQTESGTSDYFLYDVGMKSAKLLFEAKKGLRLLASHDLSVIYVIASESLAPGTPPLSTTSEYAGPSPENLYRYDDVTEKLKFVIQANSQAEGSVSADGRYYYFQATGVAGVFREVDPGASDENEQVYRYDSGENLIECMSCVSASNSRPQRFATFVKEDIEAGLDGIPRPTMASENGDYVFFDTAAELVPQDVDGEVHPCTKNSCDQSDENGNHDFFYSVSSDVYEWRKNGVDGCSKAQGCLALISSGTGGLKNVLLGTTPSGKDVFFTTHARLAGQDTDNQGDVYDARVGGGFPPPSHAAPECDGDACVSPVAPPIDAAPASLFFSGPGNAPPVVGTASKGKAKAKPCRSGTVRSKGRCVRRKRARNGRRGGRSQRIVNHGRGGRK